MKISHPLEHATYGAAVSFGSSGSGCVVDQLEGDPSFLPDLLHRAGGLLVLKGLNSISEAPDLLVRISRLLGPEIENYYDTLTAPRFFHPEVPEVLVLSNLPPCNQTPPPRPDPWLTKNGELPVQFSHRKGWHTDQSYRRPPPDISLLYAIQTPPKGQGQTLYCNCALAYESLDESLQRQIETLTGIHAPNWVGRSEKAVRAGETPKPLLSHQRPQHHRLVRTHPVTGRPALYLCEDGQMDFVDGPIKGMETGPDGEGAALLYRLVTHATQRCFVYVHEWTPGDLVIGDNRSLLHSATWYDTDKHPRLMWRTTVMGNPGREYEGEPKSWISREGYRPMHGLDDA